MKPKSLKNGDINTRRVDWHLHVFFDEIWRQTGTKTEVISAHGRHIKDGGAYQKGFGSRIPRGVSYTDLATLEACKKTKAALTKLEQAMPDLFKAIWVKYERLEDKSVRKPAQIVELLGKSEKTIYRNVRLDREWLKDHLA